jgi:hypothetical protein
MNLWRLNNHLTDAIRADGDTLALNLDHAGAVKNLEIITKSAGKKFCTAITDSDDFCFAFLNTEEATPDVLDQVWGRMSYGSTIFFSSYTSGASRPMDKVIKKFMDAKDEEITVARQMLLNGQREINLVVKCFPRAKKYQHPTDNKTVTIATVFKTGGEYDVSYVNHIANSIRENVTIPYEFVCLTDHFEGYGPNVNRIIPLENAFPKWWGKMELFKPRKFQTEKIFYLDLDTLVVSNIDSILQYGGNFFGLRDFYHQYGLGSGVMCWQNNNAKVFQLYERFMESPTANMNNHRYGDQEFIDKVLGSYIEYVQDLYPKNVVSYKKDCAPSGGIPPDAKIICFHGPPRPHQVKTPEFAKYWRG